MIRSDNFAFYTYKRLSIVIFSVVSLCIIFSGCATPVQRYDQISFSWTSEHHLPPNERFINLNLSNESTAAALKDWVDSKGGDIVENKNCDVIVEPDTDSESNFLAVQNIVKKEWEAYDANKYRKWEEGEWEKLLNLSKNQIQFIDTQNNNGKCITARLGERKKTIEYLKQVGTTQYMQQTYIYTQSGMIPGAKVPVNQPKYETRKSKVAFVSEINFFIFNYQGSTRVYAVGTPVDSANSVKAAYGATARYPCWPLITGKDETEYIMDAYSTLKNIDQ